MINKDLFNFLKELKNNNNKDWFDENRKRYQDLRKEFMDFISVLILELNKMEPEIKNIEPKDCVFRINRDIRFSKDKSPYKTNMGAYIAPGGKKSMKPGYYLHLEPGSSFAAGGLYMPPSPELKAVRTEIFENPEEYLSIVQNPEFVKIFGEVEGEKLKTAPKGFPKEDKNIDLIKLKSYTVMHKMNETSLSSPNALGELMHVYKTMQALNRFLMGALE